MHYYVQHLNDLSGSPLILRGRLDTRRADEPAMLITNQTEGFLSGWPGPTVRYRYTKHEGRARRFVSLSAWYLKVARYLLRNLRAGDRLTVSTLVGSPVLAVIMLRTNIRAELLVNEIFFRVPLWRSLGLRMARSTRVHKVYLSRFVADTWAFGQPSEIVYPTLRKDLIALSDTIGVPQRKDRDALKFFLVGSQIEAKGYRLFIGLARHYAATGARHSFALYLSGSPARFGSDYPDGSLPANLSVRFNDSSPAIFAGKDVFLGLTSKALWLETFGQTFAEAMMMGNIVVVPDEGAQLEYISDGISGFLFATHSVDGVVRQIERIRAQPDLDHLAAASRAAIRAFYGLA
jgi:glycosyltransferase involved in cell wall biosynthesis